MSGTHGLERYKEAMLATAALLYAAKPDPVTPELCLPVSEPQRRLSRVMIADIRREVALHYHIPQREMVSANHCREVAWPRQVAMYLSLKLTANAKAEIGRRFNRDGTTVFYACRAIEARMSADPRLDREVRMLAARLGRSL